MASISLLQYKPSLMMLLASLSCSYSFAVTNPPPSPVRAAFLGGWLVIEGWMTPELFDGIVNSDILDGTQVQFKSVTQNKYLSAVKGGGLTVAANQQLAGEWEKFKIWRNNSKFQFKVFNNQFIGLGDQGQDRIVAVKFSPGEQETFEIIRKSDEVTSVDTNYVRLRASNGHFVQVKQDSSLMADGQEDTSWTINDSSVFLMEIVDGTRMRGEFQLTNGYGKEMASTVLRNHWSSYIVEGDFKNMSQKGINAVRIPVGYWIAQGSNPPWPYVGGSLSFLDDAFDWAEKYNISVIIDLHAAPGSQNGWQHSGSRDRSQEWGKTQRSIDQTIEVIDFLSRRYAQRTSFLAMEPLNEPLAPGVGLDALKAYYKASYDTVRNHSKSCYVIMSNRLGEHEPTELLYFASGFDGTVIDVHYYNIFEEELNNMSVDENIEYVRTQRSSAISTLSLPNGPLVFIGEWTAALNNASDDEAQKFAAAQLDVFGRASFGWAYSTYKNINNHWSLEWMINNGYITLNN